MMCSFFVGGFECSSHRRCDGVRLDLLHSTAHAINVAADYRQLREHGIYTVRDGARWHLIEHTPNRYDWSSFFPMLHAAEREGVQVIWDLCHYGWPDHLDIWAEEFVLSFARYARAVASALREK